MDIKEKLKENEQKVKQIQASLQQLQQTNQDLLQALIRLDGQHILLIEMQAEEEANGKVEKS